MIYKIDNLNLSNIDNNTLKILIFIHNALEKGWEIKKNENKYVFKKKHNNNEEMYTEKYLDEFIMTNLDNIKLDSLE